MKKFVIISLSVILFSTLSLEAQVGTGTYALSKKAFDLRGKKTAKQGPNCWNAALVGAGLLKHIRHTRSSELQFFLNSPICEAIPKDFQEPGDMQVFVRKLEGLDAENKIAHANIWMSPGLAFNKMTQYVGAPFDIVPHRTVLEKFQYYTDIFIFTIPQSDGSFKQITCPKGTVCETEIQYYRCHGKVGDHIGSQTSDPYLLDLYAEIDEIEAAVEEIVMSGEGDYAALETQVEALTASLASQSYSSPGDKWAAEYLAEALGSLAKQFTY